jgi:hypothetical protein
VAQNVTLPIQRRVFCTFVERSPPPLEVI